MFKTDLQIAQECNMEHILKVAENAGIPEEYVDCYGKYKGKISSKYYDKIKDKVKNSTLEKVKNVKRTRINSNDFSRIEKAQKDCKNSVSKPKATKTN